MAKLLQAYVEFGPKVRLNPTVGLDQLADFITARTSVNKGEVMMVLSELSAAAIFFNKLGTPIKFPGIGTLTPTIDRTGKFSLKFRADSALKNAINAVGAFTGEIGNAENIGLDNAGYKLLWDAAHPTDPLDITPAGAGPPP